MGSYGETARCCYDPLEALSRGDLDATDWLKWFLEQVVAACGESAGTVERVLQTARFWMRHTQSGVNSRQRKALNALLDTGSGGFVGGMTATAQRDLAELAERGILRTEGAGRSVRYVLEP